MPRTARTNTTVLRANAAIRTPRRSGFASAHGPSGADRNCVPAHTSTTTRTSEISSHGRKFERGIFSSSAM